MSNEEFRKMLPEFRDLATVLITRLLIRGTRDDLLLADRVHKLFDRFRIALEDKL